MKLKLRQTCHHIRTFVLYVDAKFQKLVSDVFLKAESVWSEV